MGNGNRDYELIHYGVIGMKWGVRRSKNVLRKNIRKDSKTIHESNAKLIEFGKRRRAGHQPSQDELKTMGKVADERDRAMARRSVYSKVCKDIDAGTISLGKDFIIKNANLVFDANSEYYKTKVREYNRYYYGWS